MTIDNGQLKAEEWAGETTARSHRTLEARQSRGPASLSQTKSLGMGEPVHGEHRQVCAHIEAAGKGDQLVSFAHLAAHEEMTAMLGHAMQAQRDTQRHQAKLDMEVLEEKLRETDRQIRAADAQKAPPARIVLNITTENSIIPLIALGIFGVLLILYIRKRYKRRKAIEIVPAACHLPEMTFPSQKPVYQPFEKHY